MVKLADLDPDATVSAVGVEAPKPLSDSVTTYPPAGAAAESVTVAESDVPPFTLEGLRTIVETEMEADAE